MPIAKAKEAQEKKALTLVPNAGAGLFKKRIETAFGPMLLLASDKGMRALAFPGNEYEAAQEGEGHPILEQCACELNEYFAGQRREFTVPIDLQDGTAFQRRVWQSLMDIPYGTVISYSEQARRLGVPKAFRAVGAANGKNRLSILIPCHRVVNSLGQLHGYAGGLEMKRWLLEREGHACEGNRTELRKPSPEPMRPLPLDASPLA